MVAIKDMLGDQTVVRADGRKVDELRPVRITRHFTDVPEGSVLIECGNTRVMCTATFTAGVPRWRKDSGLGWVTAEYAMLPRATADRTDRESVRGKIGGRTHEISRLIGRCLRGVVDMKALGENQVQIDCDVLQADGGTRTASITGAYVALVDAMHWAEEHKHVKSADRVLKDWRDQRQADAGPAVHRRQPGHDRHERGHDRFRRFHRDPGHRRASSVQPRRTQHPARPRRKRQQGAAGRPTRRACARLSRSTARHVLNVGR